MRRHYLYFIVLVLAGCVTKQKSPEMSASSASGVQWETKAQVRDFRNNKTNNLSIDIVAVRNSFLRLEVSATLGYPVASFVSTPRDIKMAIYPQKKYYFGPNSEEALRPLLSFPLDPNVFQNIVFDFPIRGWKCETGKDGLVSACKKTGKSGDVVVAWQERKTETKRVVIQGPQFEMEWVFQDRSEVAQLKNDLYKLDPPSGYQVIPLN